MIKYKKILISLLLILLVSLFMFKDKIVSFANEDGINSLKKGLVIKNGTEFNLEDYYVFKGNPEYFLIFNYYDYDNEYVWSTDRIQLAYPSQEYPDNKITIGYSEYDYWIITDIYTLSTNVVINLKAIKYEEPSFSIECEPKIIDVNTYSECNLYVEYLFGLKNVSFTLETGELAISEEKPSDGIKIKNKKDNSYVLGIESDIENSYSTEVPNINFYEDIIDGETFVYAPFAEKEKKILLNFKLNSTNGDEIKISKNVQVTNLSYEDVYLTKNVEDLYDTVIQNKVEEEKVTEEEKAPEEMVANELKDEKKEEASVSEKETVDEGNPNTSDIIVSIGSILLIVVMLVVASIRRVSELD